MKDLEIEKLKEFDGHKMVNFVFDSKSGLRGFVAIHRPGPVKRSLGATRFWKYSSETEALRDALRLSRMMSYKSALAGLKYGGGKAVLMQSPLALRKRKDMFKAYANKINYLGGSFVTGTDVGVTDKDVKLMKKETEYVIGTKVDPAYYTALSVCNAIKTSLDEVFGSRDISGKRFAIQGVGKTGSNILKSIYKKANKIFVSEINMEQLRKMKKKYPKIEIVNPSVIHKQRIDVFVPCALSGVLNSKNVTELRCKIVAGSANNQLDSLHIGDLLHKLDILYAPDYAANAGGLISVVDEMDNKTPNKKRIEKKIETVQKTLKKIFKTSNRRKISTNRIANNLAEKIFNGNR